MSHGNARTTAHGRLRTVKRHQAGMPKAHTAAAVGISRKCVPHWIARYESEGEVGLHDRSCRPHTTPTRTTPGLEQQVLELRRGQDWIGPELGLAPRTVGRILRRYHVPYLRELDRITGALIRSSKTTAVCYERQHPGELVHMDVKKLGRIPDGSGWRAHGREAARITRDRSTRVGFDYVRSLVDDHSKLAYSEVLAGKKGATCVGFLARAAAYFAAHGIPRIERVMTDNAWAYRKSLRAVVAGLGAKQVFIRPHCPWRNGKVERFNRTLATEWAYRRVFTSNDERAAALAPWIKHYNTGRHHSALGGHPPLSRLRPTS